MKDNIKFGIKIMRYGYGIKMNILAGVLYLAAGVINMALLFGSSGRQSNYVGLFIWCCLPMLPVQTLHSVNASNMVLASPIRKKMQTSIPSAIGCAGSILIYLIMAAVNGIAICIRPDLWDVLYKMLIVLAIFAAYSLIYAAIAYKYMIFGTISLVFLLVFVLQEGIAAFDISIVLCGNKLVQYAITAALGAAVIAAAGVIGYWFTLLLYKKPLSKHSQNMLLRNQM